MDTFSDKTKVTVTVLAGLITYTFWLTSIYFNGVQNTQDIVKLTDRQSRLEAIATDVAVIKSQVADIRRKVTHE